MKLKLEENRLKKDCKKKDVVLLIETNHQINMTFEHYASSNTSFKKGLNAKSFKMMWTRVMWTYKSDVNSALGESSKEPSSSTVSTETSFDD